MNKLEIFKNERFGEIRVTGTRDEPLFCLADIAKSLELRTDGIIPRLDINGYNRIGVIDSMGREQQAYFINEKNLYRVIMRSDKKYAIEFQNWICDEVLPSIRKHGAYMTDDIIERTLTDPDYLIRLATTLKNEKARRIEVENRNAILMHVNKTYTATEVAKELNIKSAMQLNKILSDKKIQFQSNSTWVFYSKFANLGYEEIKQEVLDSGKVVYHRKFTQLGRDFIINLLNK